MQPRAIPQRPIHAQPCPVECEVCCMFGASEMRHKPTAPQFQQITEQRMPLCMTRLRNLAPIKLRRPEGLFRSWIRDAGLGLRRAKALESSKLFAPALHDLGCQLRAEVAEKQ